MSDVDDEVEGEEQDEQHEQPEEHAGDEGLSEQDEGEGDPAGDEELGDDGTDGQGDEGMDGNDGEGYGDEEDRDYEDEERGDSDPSDLGIPNEDQDEDEDMPFPNRLAMVSARSGSATSSRSQSTSAVINLRGSRPNSAAIAQEIEGFEDDFMERVDEEEGFEYDGYAEGEDHGEGDVGDGEEEYGPTVDELIDRGQQEQLRLQELNEMLQKRARLVLDHRNKGRPPANRDLSMLDGVVNRYRSALKMWVDTLEERDRVEGHYQTNIFDMKSMLEDRIKRADDINKAYKHFRLEVAKSAEHSKSGRPISDRLLAHLEQDDQEKEEEVQRVRLKNIHLNNQMKRLEQTLKQKEELAEGLHLIDFEQLKIENQSLNEKIEERNEELLKLRKKTTTTVQILTHVREKLLFVEKENGGLAAQHEELDRLLAEKRDSLGKVKATRDALRLKGRKIKQASVYVTNPGLLDDIEVQKEKREALTAQVKELKHEYAALAATIEQTNSKIISMTEELASNGSPNVIRALRSFQQSSRSLKA